jgi:predicted DNA-binding transcriptional regulator AlpA
LPPTQNENRIQINSIPLRRSELWRYSISVHNWPEANMPVHVGPSKANHPRSVDAFCERQGFCRATLYNLWKSGRGPRFMKVGSRRIITPEAEADWQREMEKVA